MHRMLTCFLHSHPILIVTKMMMKSLLNQLVADCDPFLFSNFIYYLEQPSFFYINEMATLQEAVADCGSSYFSINSEESSQNSFSNFNEMSNEPESVATCESSFFSNNETVADFFSLEKEIGYKSDHELLWLDTYAQPFARGDLTKVDVRMLIGEPFILKPNTVLKLSPSLVDIVTRCLHTKFMLEDVECYIFEFVIMCLRVVDGKVHAFALGVMNAPVLYVTWEEKAEDMCLSRVQNFFTRTTYAFSKEMTSLVHIVTDALPTIKSIMNRTYEALAICYTDIAPCHILMRRRPSIVALPWLPPNWNNFSPLKSTMKCSRCGRITNWVCDCGKELLTSRQIVRIKKAMRLKKEDEADDAQMENHHIDAMFSTKRLPFKNYRDITSQINIVFAEPSNEKARFFHNRKVTQVNARKVKSEILANEKWKQERAELAKQQLPSNVALLVDKLVAPKKEKGPSLVPNPPKQRKEKKIEPELPTPVVVDTWKNSAEVYEKILADLFGAGKITPPPGFKVAQGDPETGEHTESDLEEVRPATPIANRGRTSPTLSDIEEIGLADEGEYPELDTDIDAFLASPITDVERVRTSVAIILYNNHVNHPERNMRANRLRLDINFATRFMANQLDSFDYMLACAANRSIRHPDTTFAEFYTRFCMILSDVVLAYNTPHRYVGIKMAQGFFSSEIKETVSDLKNTVTNSIESHLHPTLDVARDAIMGIKASTNKMGMLMEDLTTQAKQAFSEYFTPYAKVVQHVDSVLKWTDFLRIALRFTAFARSDLDWTLVLSVIVDTMADIGHAIAKSIQEHKLKEAFVEVYKLKEVINFRDHALRTLVNTPELREKYRLMETQWKIEHPDYETSHNTMKHCNPLKFTQGKLSLFDNLLAVFTKLTDSSMKCLRNFNTIVTAWRNAVPLTSSLVKLLPNCIRELLGLVNDNLLVSEEDFAEFTQEFAAVDKIYAVEPRDILEIPMAKLKDLHAKAVEFYRRAAMCVTRGMNTMFLSYACKRLSTIIQSRGKAELLGARRYNPIGILLHGKPGVGKSEVAKKIANHCLEWAKEKELLADQTFAMMANPGIYSFQSQLDFFDGYHREGVMVIDELGSRTDGEDITNLFSLISSNTFIPPMASLEDDVVGTKATPFTSHTVIACGNISQFDHLSGAFITPEAINRRFVFKIEVRKVSDEFTDDFSHLRFAIEGVYGEFELAELLYILRHHPSKGFVNFFKKQMKIDHGLMELKPVDMSIFGKKLAQGRGMILNTQLTLATIGSILATGLGVAMVLDDGMVSKIDGWAKIIVGGVGLIMTYLLFYYTRNDDRHPITSELLTPKKTLWASQSAMEVQSGKGGGRAGAMKTRTIRSTAVRGRFVNQGDTTKIMEEFRAALVDCQTEEEIAGVCRVFKVRLDDMIAENIALDPSDAHLREKLTQGIGDYVAMSIEDKAARALCRIEVWRDNKKVIGMNAIPLGHIYWLAPKHLVASADENCCIKLRWLAGNYEFTAPFNSEHIHMTDVGDDAVAYAFKNIPWRCPSLYKAFIRDAELDYIKRCPLSLVTKNRGEDIIGIYSVIGEKITEPDEYFGPDGTRYQFLRGFHYEMNTTFGDCGGPIICHDKSIPHKIVGFHVAGMADLPYGMAQLITYEQIEKAIGPDLMARADMCTKITMGEIEVIGLHKPKLASVRKTQFYRTTVDCFEVEKSPVDLHIVDGVDPILNAMMKNAHDRSKLKDVKPEIVERVAEHLIAKMEVGGSVLSFEDALVRIDNLDRINPKSSPGYPYILTGRKTDLIEIGETGEISLKDPRLKEDTNRIISEAKHHIPNIVWISCGKDECLKLGKAPRIFEIPPFSFTIALRQYFGEFVSYIHANPMKFASLVGINPESPQWNQLMLKLRTVSKVGLAVDWKKYDSTLVRAAFQLLVMLANYWYNDGTTNGKIRYNLVMAALSRVTVFEEFVLAIFGGNPSGWMLTTIVNSFGQYLLFADFWLSRAPASLRDLWFFDECVAMFVYGDDGIMTIDVKARDFFTFEKLRDYFVDYGMTLTSDAKDGTGGFKPVEELTILKRGFRRDEMGLWVPTMSTVSLHNMMNWHRKSKFATPEETMKAVLYNFSIFMYFYGKAEYNRVMRDLSMPHLQWEFFHNVFYEDGGFSVFNSC